MKNTSKKLLCLAMATAILLPLFGCGKPAEVVPAETIADDPNLNGKRILFIGDSFLFSGKAVLTNKGETQQERQGDVGYFYQICKANQMDVEVTDSLSCGCAAVGDESEI